MPTRAKRGNATADAVQPARGPMSDDEIELFYRRVYLPLVRRATWKHGIEREQARDIVQDAFVLALTRLKPSGNPKAWLIQVVDHLSINYRRRAMRRAGLFQKWGFDGEVNLAGREKDDSDS